MRLEQIRSTLRLRVLATGLALGLGARAEATPIATQGDPEGLGQSRLGHALWSFFAAEAPSRTPHDEDPQAAAAVAPAALPALAPLDVPPIDRPFQVARFWRYLPLLDFDILSPLEFFRSLFEGGEEPLTPPSETMAPAVRQVSWPTGTGSPGGGLCPPCNRV